MSSINSIFGSSFKGSFDFQDFSDGAMENHNCHSHLKFRERSPDERSNRESNRKERRQSQRQQPENVQDRHLYPHLPYLVPREAERPPAGQAKVLNIHMTGFCFKQESVSPKVMPGCLEWLQWWQLFLPYRQSATYH